MAAGQSHPLGTDLQLPEPALPQLPAFYLVNTVGPHLADLVEKVREDAAVAKDFPRGTLAHVPDLKR
ncbi:hypothetical protein SMICM17S_05667 [Streptomyces microflavus]